MSDPNLSPPNAAGSATVLETLARHAQQCFANLQSNSSNLLTPDQQTQRDLWALICASIIEDKSHAHACSTECVVLEFQHDSIRLGIQKRQQHIPELVEILMPGQPENSAILAVRAEVQELMPRPDEILVKLRPLRTRLYNSVLACFLVRFGTKDHPSAFFEEVVKHTRSLPKDEQLKYIQSVCKQQEAFCWQDHGITPGKQQQFQQLKVDSLLSAAKWYTTWCKEEFEFKKDSKSKESKKAAKGPASDPAHPKIGIVPSSSVCIAKVTANITQRTTKDDQLLLYVPVSITCDNLVAKQRIRLKAVDCLVGGEVVSFLQPDDKPKLPSKDNAKCNDCVTLVLKVIYVPGLLISEESHTDICITLFDDTPHELWLAACCLAAHCFSLSLQVQSLHDDGCIER
jgi:hypothetical protein